MKITGKMILHWSIAMALVLIVAFGSVTLTLALIPVKYGLPMGDAINFAHLSDIRYAKQSGGKQLLADIDREPYNEAIIEILEHINSAGSTNKLKQLFQEDGEETITNNNSSFNTVRSFQNYHTQFIKISFSNSNPQFGIKSKDKNLSFVSAGTQPEINETITTLWMILIPLDNIANKFSQQSWYLVRYNPMETDELNLSITLKFTTYGNYFKLAKYIEELEVL